MKRLALALYSVLFFLAFANTCVLAQNTYTAASCNPSDVQAAVNSAADGDIVNIPAGRCTWTSGVTVPSNIGITITGSGTPSSGSSTSVPSSSCSSGTTVTLSASSTTTAFTMNPEYGNSTSRLSCLTVAYGSGPAVAFKVLGTCTSSGCPNLRMDNMTFSNWAGHTEAGISYGIGAIGDMFGVIDHNTVNGSSGTGLDFTELSNASYLGVGSYGDNSWAQPENYGSANFLFFENNTFNYAAVGDNEGSAGSLNNQGGGRVVARYNTFALDSGNVALSWHGTESSGRPRSGRAWEFYENTMSCPASTECLEVIGARGGTGLTWANTFNFGTSAGLNNFVNLNTYRTQGDPSSTWGPCDGSSPYDTNDGTTYYSGTISSVSGNTVTVSGSPGWTTDQWYVHGSPYSLHDTTSGNTGTEISGNGSNTLTLNVGGGPGAYTPTAGHTFQILRATKCIDQGGGRGAGYLYSGTTPQTTAASEVASPTYVWMNTLSAGVTPGFGMVDPDTARVIANRDYYVESLNQGAQASATSPFNGSSGMGHGTASFKPSTCTTGVGYWDTTNTELWLCTATNTWTVSYTPYTYPHPLTGTGTGTTLPPPMGLQATVH
jgi:hypothetical protein